MWLRANCRCPVCRDPGTGQRLVGITDLPASPVVAQVRVSDASVEVVFGPDGHQSVFGRDWLARYTGPADPAADSRVEDAKHLWAAADRGHELPQGWWPRYLADPPHRAACLSAVLTEGLVVLHDVPCEPGAVLAVARSLGYVRETNYGRLFDVRVEATPANLAFTSLAIAPHTDNPYRDPVPTLQLLHCLHGAAGGGGGSTFVDGFGAAAVLRAEDPAAFACLTTTPVTFGYEDESTVLRATGPMIALDPRGRIRQVRVNGRSLLPVHLPAAEAAAFYAAYRCFAALIARPDGTVTTRLSPGDCVIVDNTRILHGRAAFTDRGGGHDNTRRRHLQGCYADLDGLESALAAAARGLQSGQARPGQARAGQARAGQARAGQARP